jgi:hypothetical protein
VNKLEKTIAKNKENLKVFVNREFNFNKEKNDSNEIIAEKIKLLEGTNRFNIDGKEFEYQKMYKEGIITGLIVKGRDLCDMNKYAKAFARGNTMIVTGDRDSILHESEHVLQNILGLIEKRERWELEHDAYLISVMFSENSKASFKNVSKKIRSELNKKYFDFNDMKSLYNIQIGLPNMAGKWSFVYKMDKLLVNVKHTNESIREACKILLNESYREKIGMSYDQLIERVKE